MANVIRFRQANVAKQKGEQARLKVVQGPDYGSIYVLLGPTATIGRGEDNDIVIADLKASRHHAVFQFKGTGWIVKDVGSANGIIVNGEEGRESKLSLKDTVKLGETTLEFVSAEAGTMMLITPPRDIRQIQAEQAAFEVQKKRARAQATPTPGGKNSKSLLIGAIMAVVLISVLFSAPKQAPKNRKKGDGEVIRDLSSLLPKVEDQSINKAAELFFKTGFREYRERNYLRARTQFETVLQIDPGHRLAKLYLDNCSRDIEEEVKVYLEAGKKSLKAGKLKDARANFAAILRLLHRDQSSPDYIEAQHQLTEVQKTLTGRIQ